MGHGRVRKVGSLELTQLHFGPDLGNFAVGREQHAVSTAHGAESSQPGLQLAVDVLPDFAANRFPSLRRGFQDSYESMN